MIVATRYDGVTRSCQQVRFSILCPGSAAACRWYGLQSAREGDVEAVRRCLNRISEHADAENMYRAAIRFKVRIPICIDTHTCIHSCVSRQLFVQVFHCMCEESLWQLICCSILTDATAGIIVQVMYANL